MILDRGAPYEPTEDDWRRLRAYVETPTGHSASVRVEEEERLTADAEDEWRAALDRLADAERTLILRREALRRLRDRARNAR